MKIYGTNGRSTTPERMRQDRDRFLAQAEVCREIADALNEVGAAQTSNLGQDTVRSYIDRATEEHLDCLASASEVTEVAAAQGLKI